VIITPTSFDRLFVSDFRAAERLANENPLGIRTVLGVCIEKIQSRCPDITYVQFPMLDAQPLEFEMVDEVMHTVARSIIGGGVLIHCAAGLSRSPVMVALYFDLVGFKNFDEALNEVSRLRTVDPSPVIVRSAKQYLRMRVQEG
jgi:protein-tyrosine phosphatase